MMLRDFLESMEKSAKLKVSKTRKKSSKIEKMKTLPLSMNLVKTYSSDILEMGYLYVQGMPFHQSICSGYKFRTIEALRGKKKPNREDTKAK